MSRRAVVRLDGQRVGMLTEETGGNRVTFAYDPDYEASPGAVPVSLTLPLGKGPWETRGIHPFFAGLLPEGWLRALAHRKMQVDENDEFGLLMATGADCIGAVEVVAEPEP